MANVAITTPATEAANAKLIDPGVKKVWFDEFSQLAPKLDSVFNVSSMDGAYEEHTSYAGLGEAESLSEGETYGEDAVLHTYNTTFTAQKYGKMMPVSYELLDDQYAKVAGQTKSAARATARTVEKLGAQVYNKAFNTSYTSFGDSKPLCSTDHTRADGGSAQSNASSTSIVFSEANLETGVLAMRNQLDDRGNLLDVVPTTILVPPALEKEVIIVTKSEKRSGTADNDANVNGMAEYTGGRLRVIVWNYLGSAAGGSDTAWFLLGGQNELAWKWRKKPYIEKMSKATGEKNDISYWKYGFRAISGWTNWRALWGSQGTAAAYSS